MTGRRRNSARYQSKEAGQTLYSKAATHWTRLSCHRFRANEVR